MLDIENLDVSYGEAPAVRDFNLHLEAGETCLIVGESGGGKSTVLRAIMGLLPRSGKVTGGTIALEGRSLRDLSPAQWRDLRGNDISMIFQDTGAMMNPTRTVGSVFCEYIRSHRRMSRGEAWKTGTDMLERMCLDRPENVMRSYPFQLSGGMRQRVGIAMAMAFRPKLLLADEPTSALDVTTQAQIVQQMMELADEYDVGIVMVTHNVGVAARMADKLMIMRQGEVVDAGDADHILYHSNNEYTRSLIGSVPTIGGERFV